ncbi:MAG: hypothetical protein AAGE52_03660 [Myxococcota bacterium]
MDWLRSLITLVGGAGAAVALVFAFRADPPAPARADSTSRPRDPIPVMVPPQPFLAPRREEPAATPAAERVLETLAGVRENLRETRYQHRTVVRERRGKYLWDCSGMADWVLRRAARRAQRALHRERPVARTFFRTIDRAPTDRARRGWQKIAHIEDVRPGDVFAWLRPPNWPRRNTGHVGFVLEAPRRVNHWPGAYVVRIADSTSVPHQDDTRDLRGEGGYGEGTILWMTDGAGTALSYGWFGALSPGVVETRAVFGRVHR